MIRYDQAHTVMAPELHGKWVKYAEVVKMVKKLITDQRHVACIARKHGGIDALEDALKAMAEKGKA